MARAPRPPTDAALRELRAFGLAYPGAHTKSPWPGHADLAVDDKTFAYLSVEGEPLAISCKLPRSNALALMVPGAKPAAYGLGKSGWVAVTFAGPDVPVAMLKDWLDESYRAQASKKRVAALDAAATPAPVTRAPRARAPRPAARASRPKAPSKTSKPTAAPRRARPAAR